MLVSTMERRDCPSEDDFNYLNLYFSEAAEMCMELEDWSDEVNTKHDASSYESCGYEREIISDANVLLDAYNKASQNSSWKPQVQQFENNLLEEIGKLQTEVRDREYELSPTNDFILNERGKIRLVSGDQIRDRVMKHALCDEILSPETLRFMIHDNGASQPGKGIQFTRRRLVAHLQRYYRQYGNKGYVLLIDFTKYFDNIQHQIFRDMLTKIIDNEEAIFVLDQVLKAARVDVSYMDDEAYSHCMQEVFNSLKYQEIDRSLLTGEKFMCKHMNIGDQVSQIAGIFYPIAFDNYIKIVRGMKFYGRYMDDSYILHPDKQYLSELLNELIYRANSLGITINQRKTRIVPISDYWRFLQIQYSLTDTGRVIQKINPKRLTKMRKHIKKVAKFMTEKEFGDYYTAWFRSNYKIMSRRQRENMDNWYKSVKEEIYSCTP